MNTRRFIAICPALLSALVLAAPLCAQVDKGPYLIYENDPSKMSILWQLNSTQTCTLEWGLTTGYGTSTTTTEYGTDNQHGYTITGLTASTLYYYRVSYNAGADVVGTGSFRTAPDPSATTVKLLAYGDTRSRPADHNSVCGRMLTTLSGDANYQTAALFAGDWINSDTEADWQNQFFPRTRANIVSFQTKVPIMGCRGNHEGTGAVYRKYYPYPYGPLQHYYSFDYGPVHVSVVDQYVNYAPGSAQLTWLENDLAMTQKPWRILVFHAPGYSAGGHGDNTDVKNRIQPLCITYGADLVLAGHNHYYARCDVSGVQHVTTGGGGAPLYAPATPPSGTYPTLVSSTQSRHFCEIDVDGTSMTVTVRREGDGTGPTDYFEQFTIPRRIVPTAAAGTDQVLVDGDNNGTEDVTLDGSGSSDDGTITSYEWLEGGSAIATGASTSATLAVGTHHITLKVTDNDGHVNCDELIVVIADNTGSVSTSSRISATGDDAEEQQNGYMYTNSSDLELVFDAGTNQVVGLRFTNLAIPPGVTINDAYVQFTTDTPMSGATSLTVAGEDADNAVMFRFPPGNIGSRTATTASVPWNPPAWNTVDEAGVDQRTPNLASVIQEIVDRGGWTCGNDLALLISGTGERVAYSFEGDSAKAPVLYVTYFFPANPVLTWSVTGTGTVSRAPAGSDTTTPSASGASTYSSGQVVAVTANPGAGQVFVNWTGPVANVNAASTTVTMNADKSITANFAAIQRTLTWGVSGSGDVSRTPTGSDTTTPSASGTSTYADGTVVTVTATPAAGWTFVNWTGNVADVNAASTTVTMNADESITANFAPTQRTLTWSVTGSGTVSRAPTGSNTTTPSASGTSDYDHDTVVTVTATPAAGWMFANWTGPVADVNAASTTVTMDADRTIEAHFETALLSVTPATGFATGGQPGGVFTPPTKDYLLTNPGTTPLDWTALITQPWVEVSPGSGTLAGGAAVTVTVSLTAAADALAVGVYTDTVSFTNTTTGAGNTTRNVTLSVGGLSVTGGDFTPEGNEGGPFVPATATYTLTNSGGVAIEWTATADQPWLVFSTVNGTLAAGGSIVVTVTLDPSVNAIPDGTWTATITFTNITNGTGTTSKNVRMIIHDIEAGHCGALGMEVLLLFLFAAFRLRRARAS